MGTEEVLEAVTEATKIYLEPVSETEEILEAVTEEETEVGLMEEIIENMIGEEQVEALKDPNAIATWWSGTYPQVISFILQVILAIIVIVIGIRLIHMLMRFITRSFEKGSMDKGVQTFLTSLIKYGLYFLLIMLVLSGFGIAASSVVAILGSAGLTIGLGFQGSLSNIAGGVLILILKPFEVDEYIACESGEGTVTEITICYTHLLTIDNKRIVVPNGTLSNTTVTNYTRMQERRIDLQIGITYESDMKRAKDVALAIVDGHEDTIRPEDTKVIISALGDSSVTLEIRVWTRTEVYWPTRWDLIEALKDAFDHEPNVEVAYPHMTVVEKEKPQMPAEK